MRSIRKNKVGRALRIGLVIYGSLETLSGGFLYDQKLVQYLGSVGHEVRVHAIPWRSYALNLLDNFSSSLRGALAAGNYDLLLEDELNHPSLFWFNRRLKTEVRYPIVAIVHHLRSSEARPDWQNRFYSVVERAYLRTIDAFIYNSRTTRDAVEGLNGSERPCVVAYPSGDRFNPRISQAEIAARARLPGPLRILFLGNIIPRKGLRTLLQAVGPLPHDQWELKVVGSLSVDPSYVRGVRRWVVDNGLVDSVRFLDAISEQELVEQLRTSHVLAIPSSYEGYGIAYLEGMSFGLPAIATTAGAAREIITSGRDGFLIEPDDVEALRSHLRQLINNREQLVIMSAAARSRFLEQPRWQDTTEKITTFLETLLMASGQG